MGNFDRYSNKPSNAPFTGVTFGFGSTILEVELNEMQQIQNDKIISLLGINGDCVIDRGGFSYDGNTLTINTKIVKDGIMLETIGATLELANGQSAYISSEIVDYTYGDVIKANGNTNGETIDNTIMDDRGTNETTRRKGYRFTINTESGMLLGTVIDNKFICLAQDHFSGIHRYITDCTSAPSKKGGVKVNRLYGRSIQDGIPTPDAPVEIKITANPVVKTCGKNLIPFPYYSGTSLVSNGITFTVNDDGSVTANGTATNSAFFTFANENMYSLENGKTYAISRGKTKNIYMFIQNSSSDFASLIVSESTKFTCNDIWRSIGCYIKKGKTVTNETIYPMLVEVNEDGTYSTEYEPYTGQTATLPYTLNAIPVESGGNITIDGQQYIADYVDFEKRQLVRLCGVIDSYSSEEITTAYISTTGELSEGAIVAYQLETPEVVDITADVVQQFAQLYSYYPITNVFASSAGSSPILDFEVSNTETGAKSLENKNMCTTVVGGVGMIAGEVASMTRIVVSDTEPDDKSVVWVQ